MVLTNEILMRNLKTSLKELVAKKVALQVLLYLLHLACLTFQLEPKGQMRSKWNFTNQKILASSKIFPLKYPKQLRSKNTMGQL